MTEIMSPHWAADLLLFCTQSPNICTRQRGQGWFLLLHSQHSINSLAPTWTAQADREIDRWAGQEERGARLPSTFGCRCGLTLPAPSRSLNPELPCLGRMHIHQGTPQGKFWLHTGDFSKIQVAPPYSRSTTGYANKTGFQGLPKPKKLPHNRQPRITMEIKEQRHFLLCQPPSPERQQRHSVRAQSCSLALTMTTQQNTLLQRLSSEINP